MSKPGLIKLIKEHALDVRAEGEPPFILKSGLTSRYYLDLRRVTLWGPGLRMITNIIWENLNSIAGLMKIDAIGGPTVGADPIVGGLLYATHNLRGFLVRPMGKGHGNALGERVIGSMQIGDNCLMIEDVITTGGTTLSAIDAVEANGGKVVGVIAVVDRENGASEALAARNILFKPLINATELGIK